MHNLESVLENEMHKNLWNFEVKPDYLISAKQPPPQKVQQQQKKICWIMVFGITADHRVKLKKKKNEKRDK